jgi:plastocyanin
MTELIRAIADGRRPRPRALLVPLLMVVVLAVAGFAVAALAGVGPLAELGAGAGTEPRTIVVAARNMTFVVDGAEGGNPRIAVERGERIRFVLKNEDPGMAHDLSVPALDVRTVLLRQAGTSADLVVTMPEQPGELEYLCSSHALLMRGVIDVR